MKNRRCRTTEPHEAHAWRGLNTRGEYHCAGIVHPEPMRLLLLEIEQWFDDAADGAPDAPAWHKEAGVFAGRIRTVLGLTYREARVSERVGGGSQESQP